MPSPPHFLIIDDNADSRFLLVKTLLRKFPGALLQESSDADHAVTVAKGSPLTAAVVHRAENVDGLTLVRRLRESNPTLPIVMVSGVDRQREALAAGANRFLNYDAWLRLGSLVAEMLAPTDDSNPNPNPLRAERR